MYLYFKEKVSAADGRNKNAAKAQKDLLARFLIGILNLIIIDILFVLFVILWIVQFIVVLIKGEKVEAISKVTGTFIDFIHATLLYISFSSNERPWPFN